MTSGEPQRRAAARPLRPSFGVVLSIQYLRAIAAMAVALSHIAGHPGLSLETGAAGVDVFFVISGFIMWTVSARPPAAEIVSPHDPGTAGRSSPGAFIIERLTRIAPPYVLLTLAIYLTAMLAPSVFPNMRTSWSHMILSVLFVPHVDPYGTAFPVIVPGWTLTYEIFFYAVFSLGLFAPPRRRAQLYTAVLVVLAATGLLMEPTAPAMKTYTNPLLLEFVAGVWLGVLWNARALPRAIWGGVALLAGFAVLVAWEVSVGTQPAEARAFVWGIPAALIVGGLVIIEQHRAMPCWQLGLLLGNSSYSMYLVNVFVVAAAWRLVGGVSVPLYLAIAVIASAAGGVAFWWAVERPLTRAARRWVDRVISRRVNSRRAAAL